MPGHIISESLVEQTKENVELLTKLVSENDVIFLLMDSRESRWLPTLLGNFLNKVCYLKPDTWVSNRLSVPHIELIKKSDGNY